MPKRYFLSKSKLNAYHQCAKRLWLEVHREDLIEISPATQRKFGVGHQVGEVARAELERSLRDYCERDTEALVRVVKALAG